MKIAIISLGGKSSKMILKEAKKYFQGADLIDIRGIEVDATSKELEVLYKGKPLKKYDCVYVRGSFRYALLQRSITRALHHDTYMPIQPKGFTLGHNKFLTLLELQKKKVAIPKTYLTATLDAAKKILDQVNYPIIMKIPSGTHGKGVMFADSVASAKSMLDTLEVSKQSYIIQEYVETEEISDIRAIVVGNKVVAAMKRKATPEEQRANIHMGGEGTPYEVDYDTEQVAVKSAKAIGADVCAVDILMGAEPLAIEVNLSPGLQGITATTKKNIAAKIAKFLFEKTKEFSETKKKKGYGEIIKEIEVSKGNGAQEILTNLDIKAGVIKLPKVITDITKFTSDDEVILIVDKGKLEIKPHKIKKEEE